MEFDLENPLTSSSTEQQPETIPDLFSSESDHMPLLIVSQTSDFHVCFRQEAISLAQQAQYSCDLDPLITYLAVNYIDRFMSKKEIQEGKPWVLNLLVISCLSLAAKIKSAHFSASDCQREQGFIFDTTVINRMELLILNALDWRMRSITPFSFLCFFISLLEPKDPPPLKQALKNQAAEFIFKAQHEIKLLEFKPSIIAASALILASHELLPVQYSSFKTSILSCQYVNKENLLACFNAMQEMVVEDGYESASSTRTPMSVLGQYYNKAVTETSSTITSAGMSMTPGKREIKRRKFNENKVSDFHRDKLDNAQTEAMVQTPDTIIKQRSE